MFSIRKKLKHAMTGMLMLDTMILLLQVSLGSPHPFI